MTEADAHDFYAVRAEQERALARNARSGEARRIHSWLADHYAAMMAAQDRAAILARLPTIRD